jgi:ClpP class serine protease
VHGAQHPRFGQQFDGSKISSQDYGVRDFAKTFRLTSKLIAAHAGSPVVCLAPSAIGQTFRLRAEYPDAATNRRLSGSTRDVVAEPDGTVIDLSPPEDGPIVTRVDVCGVIEQRAGFQEMCGGYTDGHDAIADRMCDALAQGDVVMVFDTPGGAHAGMQEAIRRVEDCKAEYGRRVTGFVDEMCGSAGYWWAACVCDEIFAPEAGIIGSIGARAAHASIAGALAREGVEVTYFAWPGEGKVAFAPELPLSDLGAERGDRDVAIAGEAFAAAVGPRRGLSRDEIVALDADALSGQMAVDAGLIDEVASYEDVLEYAVRRANAAREKPESDMNENTEAKILASSGQATRPSGQVRAEGDDPEKKEPEESGDDAPKARKMKKVRYSSTVEEEEFESEEEEESPDAEDEGDEPESEDADDAPDSEDESDSPDSPAKAKKAKRAQSQPDKEETVASILGLRRDASQLAIKSAALRLRDTLATCMSLTGAKRVGELEGHVKSLVEDAAHMAGLRATNKSLRTAAARRERMALLHKLASANLPGYPRGELFVDEVDDKGARTIKPAPAFAEMKLSTLRGFVSAKVANAPAAKKSPFQPSESAAKAAVTEGNVADASQSPLTKSIAARSSASADQIAKTLAALEAQQFSQTEGTN